MSIFHECEGGGKNNQQFPTSIIFYLLPSFSTPGNAYKNTNWEEYVSNAGAINEAHLKVPKTNGVKIYNIKRSNQHLCLWKKNTQLKSENNEAEESNGVLG